MSNVKMMLSHFEKANEDTVMNDYYAVQQSAFLLCAVKVKSLNV